MGIVRVNTRDLSSVLAAVQTEAAREAVYGGVTSLGAATRARDEFQGAFQASLQQALQQSDTGGSTSRIVSGGGGLVGGGGGGDVGKTVGDVSAGASQVARGNPNPWGRLPP